MGYLPETGSVVAYSGGTWISSLVSLTPSSVNVGASIFGQLPAGTAPIGSIATLQGTNPWIITGSIQGATTTNQSISGTVGASVIGTVPFVQSGTLITSIVSTIPSSVIVGASIFGLAPVNVTNTNINVGGSVVGFQGGTLITSLVSIVPSSVIVGSSIFGQLPAGTAPIGSVAVLQGTSPWAIAGSVAAIQNGTYSTSVMTNVITSIATAGQVMGSIATLQGTSPWNIAGSVAGFQSGTWKVSVVGTYVAGAASVVSAPGFLHHGVRNDTLASTLSSGDAQYIPMTVGPIGENIIANAPITKWISGSQSVLGPGQFGPSVIVLAAGGAGVFNYVTGLQMSNFSTPSILVTFYKATDSILNRLVIPSGGTTTTIKYTNPLKTLANAGFTASIGGTNSSVFLSAQGFTATT